MKGREKEPPPKKRGRVVECEKEGDTRTGGRRMGEKKGERKKGGGGIGRDEDIIVWLNCVLYKKENLCVCLCTYVNVCLHLTYIPYLYNSHVR